MLEIQKEELLFRGQLAALKEWTGWDDARLAEEIGCSLRTIANMRKSPASVASAYTMKVRRLYHTKEQMLRS